MLVLSLKFTAHSATQLKHNLLIMLSISYKMRLFNDGYHLSVKEIFICCRNDRTGNNGDSNKHGHSMKPGHQTWNVLL